MESNHRTELRRLPLCPLSYGAERLKPSDERGARFVELGSHALEPVVPVDLHAVRVGVEPSVGLQAATPVLATRPPAAERVTQAGFGLLESLRGRHFPQFAQSGPRERAVAAAPKARFRSGLSNRVANGTRTRDHRDHNPGLYQLSYRHRAPLILAAPSRRLPTLRRRGRGQFGSIMSPQRVSMRRVFQTITENAQVTTKSPTTT